MIHRAQFARYSLCDCGFPVLAESIPLGKIYRVYPANTKTATMVCGGCGIEITGKWIYALDERGHPGYIPIDILEIDEKPE